ncbi:myb family transcription factor EFM-like [Asparagus officinalis]|nr:myb family transcription factor EFM-like [Asparagus officinalis]
MDYIKALEKEREKILVFERELPLSLLLVTQAIESCKKPEVGGSEEISSEGPILEEFIPLRPSCSSSDEENNNNHGNGWIGDGFDKKPDWLRSVQLWNPQAEPPKGDIVRRPVAVNARKIGGAFHPFEKEKVGVKAPAAAPASSTTENTNEGGRGNGGSMEEKEKEGHSQRKARRCWSPELHRRFLHALQQLGGCHVATPKQIRELMKVDGLTNDEVKSHLQKYRLHIKRPTTPTVHNNSNSNAQQPQIVLVGSLWMPPPNYTTEAESTPSNEIYTPVASLPFEFDLRKRDTSPERDDNVEDSERPKSHSSNTSSQTTTASLP